MDEETPGWDKDAAAAMIYIQNTACRVTTDGVQILGGYGYMKDYGQEKRFRDAKQLQALLGIAPLKKLSYWKHLYCRTGRPGRKPGFFKNQSCCQWFSA